MVIKLPRPESTVYGTEGLMSCSSPHMKLDARVYGAEFCVVPEFGGVSLAVRQFQISVCSEREVQFPAAHDTHTRSDNHLRTMDT